MGVSLIKELKMPSDRLIEGHRAPGEEGNTADMLKANPFLSADTLVEFFNKVLEEYRVHS